MWLAAIAHPKWRNDLHELQACANELPRMRPARKAPDLSLLIQRSWLLLGYRYTGASDRNERPRQQPRGPECSRIPAGIRAVRLWCADPASALSVQVLQEFYVQATRGSRPDAIGHDQAVRLIASF